MLLRPSSLDTSTKITILYVFYTDLVYYLKMTLTGSTHGTGTSFSVLFVITLCTCWCLRIEIYLYQCTQINHVKFKKYYVFMQV